MKGKFQMISESSQPLQLCVLCPSAGFPPLRASSEPNDAIYSLFALLAFAERRF